jgi:hypothetical protein
MQGTRQELREKKTPGTYLFFVFVWICFSADLFPLVFLFFGFPLIFETPLPRNARKRPKQIEKQKAGRSFFAVFVSTSAPLFFGAPLVQFYCVCCLLFDVNKPKVLCVWCFEVPMDRETSKNAIKEAVGKIDIGFIFFLGFWVTLFDMGLRTSSALSSEVKS